MKTSTRSRRVSGYLVSLAVAVGSVSAFDVSAARADNSESAVPSMTVNYADLNLNTASGAIRLYRRIRYAATEVCSPRNGASLGAKTRTSACEAQAIDAAVGKVHNSNLTAYYLSAPRERSRSYFEGLSGYG